MKSKKDNAKDAKKARKDQGMSKAGQIKGIFKTPPPPK